MGNHRFRLSDMMPNAWFYKLKDMSRTRNRNTSQPIKKKQPFSQTTTTTTTQKPSFSQPRYSHYTTTEPNRADMFCNSPKIPKASDTHFPDPPRRSSNKRAKRKSIYKPSPTLVSSSVSSAACNCRATINSVWSKPISHQYDDDDDGYFFSSTDHSSPEPEFHECFQPEFESFDERLDSCCGSNGCRVGCSPTDIIIDMNEEYLTRKIENLDDDIDSISKVELTPILTKKQAKFEEDKEFTKFRRRSSRLEEIKAQNVKEDGRVKTQRDPPKSNPPAAGRKSFSTTSSTGVRLRTNSPRIARTRKTQGNARKSAIASSPKTASRLSRNKRFSESFAIVKNSIDPEKDFRESMMEMIVENNISASKDLEELLACYLLLNSNEYHDLIVKAFQQIWFGMT